MARPVKFLVHTVLWMGILFLVAAVFQSCGERAPEPSGPVETTGRPQVLNFWQPG